MHCDCSTNINKKMIIKDKILEKVRKEPKIFGEILKRMNSSNGLTVQPATFLRRLERKSEIVKTNNVISDYFREQGYTDSQIFEK